MLFLRPIGLRLTIGLSVPTLYLSSQILYPRRNYTLKCQAPYLAERFEEARQQESENRRRAELLRQWEEDERSAGIFNPKHFRQLSTGSFTGVVAGYAVGKLSRMVAFVGLLVVLVVQYLERHGYQVLPRERLDKTLGRVNYKRFLTENAAFKWSFAATFALSAWFAN